MVSIDSLVQNKFTRHGWLPLLFSIAQHVVHITRVKTRFSCKIMIGLTKQPFNSNETKNFRQRVPSWGLSWGVILFLHIRLTFSYQGQTRELTKIFVFLSQSFKYYSINSNTSIMGSIYFTLLMETYCDRQCCNFVSEVISIC